ncbi:TonB-dependent receptor plug domain-containing protein [Hymenobacter sp. HMF4947]|uniref:TonB-dependent receptor plug domain-containing protein n=1 Tax=Hymenobacter ginkgonis TaxID=2682976 RepID=A0A7K1TER8_9BACT|nr:TonB-dependent receptor [Hymenobacter ginkgonis]MVN76621.1 TonB-dependent receptor plug domain-containing protein [Hymenobacter ginkgonis]
MANFYRIILLLGLLGGRLVSHGQQGPPATISGNFQQLPFAEFARQVAATTPYRFYFNPTEVDSVRVTLQATAQPLNVVLRQVLQATPLQFAIDAEHHVYITTGVPIDTQLPADFFQVPAAEAPTPPSPALARRAGVGSPAASKVYEIGQAQPSSSGKATLSGRVRDAKSGEPVVGASVYIESPNIGASTDQFGSYTLTLPVGRHQLFVRGLGLKNTTRLLAVQGNGKLDLDVEEDITPLKEVVIEAEKDRNVTSLQMGVQKLDIKTIKQVPTVFGEADILRVILTLPGVKSVGEGNTGMSVRGGGTDQNLVLFNDATIYNPAHLFGFFSAFNPDMLKSVELYKSTVPARYGGRLSSVLDIATREGNRKQLSASGGIGLLTSRLTLEGPLAKGKGSFLVGGRTSYSDWLLKQLPSKSLSSSAASFYDLSAHISYDFSDRNSLYATGYYSRDRFRLATDTVYAYSNVAGSLKWKHVITNKLYGVLTGTFSRYQYSLASERNPTTASQLGYNLNQGGLQADFTYFLNSKHTIDFGVSSLLYQIAPGRLTPLGENSLVVPDALSTERALESALYVADRFDISPRFSVAAGLRYSLYNALGPRDVLTYQPGVSRSEGTVTGSTSYGSGQVMATYQGPEYRLSGKYAVSDNSSVKLSFNRMRQYIHQLTNTTVVSPTDSWKLSDTYIRPQVGDQVSLGYYRNFKANTIETSVEGYYKVMHDFLDYKGGATLLLNHHLETDVVNAQGKAYGVELLVRKSTGKLNGWLSYTYSRSLVQVSTGTDVINNGAYYPSNFDKPHDVTLVSNYRFSRRFSVSANFNYSTGRPITLPLAKYTLNNAVRVYYSDRNAYRVPDYYRMDLAFNIEGNHKVQKLAHSSWTVAVYNLTGRHNPYSVYFQSQNGQIKGYQLSIFAQPIPTVTYNFRF